MQGSASSATSLSGTVRALGSLSGVLYSGSLASVYSNVLPEKTVVSIVVRA